MDNLIKRPHKHAALIKCWADGAEIEFFYKGLWLIASGPSWDEETEYRIQEASKPDTIYWVDLALSSYAGPMLYASLLSEANCKLVFDGTTGKLKEVSSIHAI